MPLASPGGLYGRLQRRQLALLCVTRQWLLEHMALVVILNMTECIP